MRAGPWRTFRAFLAIYLEVSVEAVLAEAGIDAADLGKPEVLLGLRAIVAMLEAAAVATGDQALAVRFGTQAPWGDIGVLAYVAFNSATLGAAFANASRYFAVQQTAGGASLEVHGAATHLHDR